MHSFAPIFHNRNLVLIWLTGIIECLALGIAGLVQTWYIVDTLGMKEQLGWVVAVSSMPRIVLMLFGGVFADRISKLKILKATFWLRMLVMLFAAWLFFCGEMSIFLLALTGAIFGMLDAFYWPAREGFIPSVVPSEQLARVNSAMQLSVQICLIAGPILGGMLLKLISIDMIFGLIGISMSVGALLMIAVDTSTFRQSAMQVRQRETTSIYREIGAGCRYVLETPVLRLLMFISVLANLLFSGAMGIGIPVIATSHVGQGVESLSYMQSAISTGMLGGFLLLLFFPPKKNQLLLVVGAIAMEGLLLTLLGKYASLLFDMGILCLIGFLIACNNVPTMTLIQNHTHTGKLGRVMSINSIAIMGLAPVSFGLVSVLLSGGITMGAILAVFGATMTLLTLAAAFMSFRVVAAH